MIDSLIQKSPVNHTKQHVTWLKVQFKCKWLI